VFAGDIVGPVVSAGGDPFRSLECDPMPDDGTGAGRREAEGGCGATGARCAWTVVRAAIRALVDETRDTTLEELRTALAARRVWQAPARCGASFTAARSRAKKTAHGTSRIARTS
jgi:hypothetical protein